MYMYMFAVFTWLLLCIRDAAYVKTCANECKMHALLHINALPSEDSQPQLCEAK